MNKQTIRNTIAAKIAALSPKEKHIESEQVCHDVINFLVDQAIQTIALYSALDDELDVTLLFDWAQEHNIQVLLPRVEDETRMMLYSTSSFTGLPL